MGIIWQLIVGLIVGVLARFLLPGKENFPEGPLGWLLTALLGIIGAWLGTFVGQLLPWTRDGYTAGWIMSILGAILLLLVLRLVMGAKNSAA